MVDLKVERAKRRWTQEELSNRSKVCRLTISNLETGRQNIEGLEVRQLMKLAKALDIPVAKFFEE